MKSIQESGSTRNNLTRNKLEANNEFKSQKEIEKKRYIMSNENDAGNKNGQKYEIMFFE